MRHRKGEPKQPREGAQDQATLLGLECRREVSVVDGTDVMALVALTVAIVVGIAQLVNGRRR